MSEHIATYIRGAVNSQGQTKTLRCRESDPEHFFSAETGVTPRNRAAGPR